MQTMVAINRPSTVHIRLRLYRTSDNVAMQALIWSRGLVPWHPIHSDWLDTPLHFPPFTPLPARRGGQSGSRYCSPRSCCRPLVKLLGLGQRRIGLAIKNCIKNRGDYVYSGRPSERALS